MTNNSQRTLPQQAAIRFLEATRDLLRGADDYAGQPSFASTLEWLWDQTGAHINALHSADPLTLHSVRLPRFEKELDGRIGNRVPSAEDLETLRLQLVAAIEAALDDGPATSKRSEGAVRRRGGARYIPATRFRSV